MLKTYPEDFIVKEVMDLSFVGESGSYSYYLLRKRNLNFFDAVSVLFEKWKVTRDRLGFSGIKDKRAITEQYISIREGPERSLKLKNLEVKFIGKGEKPIRIGDAKGNVFRVTLRRVDKDRTIRAFQVVSEIGFANYFGYQRFVTEFGNKPLGKLLLHGRYEEALRCYFQNYPVRKVRRLLQSGWENLEEVIPKLKRVSRQDMIVLKRYAKKRDPDSALRAFPKPVKLMFLFSYQSFLWNKILSALIRRKAPTFEVRVKGKVRFHFYREMTSSLKKISELEIPYVSREALSFGEREVKEIMIKIIKEEGIESFLEKKVLGLDAFSAGKRRAIVFPKDTRVISANDERVELEFFLPSGSYATVFLTKVTNLPLS